MLKKTKLNEDQIEYLVTTWFEPSEVKNYFGTSNINEITKQDILVEIKPYDTNRCIIWYGKKRLTTIMIDICGEQWNRLITMK